MPAFSPHILRYPPAIAAFAFPIVILAGNKLLTGGVAGLALLALIWWRPANWRAASPFALMFGLIAVWGAVSAFWSITPPESIERAVRFAVLGVCGIIICLAALRLDPARREDVAAGLLVGLATAACLSLAGLVWQGFSPKSVLSALNYKPFATVAAVLLFPAAGFLLAKGRHWTVVVGSSALMILFLEADSLAAVVAATAGGGAFVLVYFGGRRAAGAVSGLVLLGIVLLPAIVAWMDVPSRIQDGRIELRHSLTHRIAVWDFVGKRIADRPFLGWGLATARNIPGADVNPLERPLYRDMLLSSRISPKSELQTLPLHPHNACLQVLLELGIPGLLLYLALCLICLRCVVRGMTGRVALATGLATATAAIVIGQVSFSVWQSWWIAAQFMTAAILLALYRTET